MGIRGGEVVPVTAQMARLWKMVGYEPHAKAMPYHQSAARFRYPACGRRFGKSRMVAADLLPDLFDEENPGRYWMVGLSYETCDEFNYLWDDVMIHMGLGAAPGMKKANNPRTGEMFIQFPWGTRIEVKSIAKPHMLVGKGLKRAVLSEAAKMSPVILKKYISPALADFRGKLDAPSTPEGFNWYFEEYEKGQSPDEPDHDSWNFPSWENRILFPGGFEDPEIQRQLPRDAHGEPIDDPWFWQEIGAEFRTMAGMIYPEFNRKIHVKPVEFNPAKDNYMGMDFGFNGFVALDAMVTPSGKVQVWREFVPTNRRPIHEYAEELRIRPSPEGYKVRCAYGDAADPDAVATISKKFARCVAKAEAKDVKAGIRLVKSLLRSPQGPMVEIDPSCVNLIRGFETYRMKQPRGMMTNQETEFKDEPLKKDDHEADAFRYLVMHLFRLGGLDKLEDLPRSDSREARGIFTFGDEDGIRMNEREFTRLGRGTL